MKFLPFETIIFRSRRSPDELIERLKQNIEPYKTFRMIGIFAAKNHKPYEGEIDNYTFKINRIIGYRNSFLPYINGTIEKDLNHTRIVVKMRLHKIVLGFMIFWFGGVIFALGSFTIFSMTTGYFKSVILIPIAMLILGYGLTLGGFKYESSKSKKDLAQLFEAEIDD